MTYRWIAYTWQIPFAQSAELSRHTSLASVLDAAREYSDAVGSDEVTGMVYAYSDERWAQCKEFEGVGCPLDYPDRTIERGPRGGWKVEHT
jgi:hypothetical protein